MSKRIQFILHILLGLYLFFSLIALLQIGWIGELLISFVPYAAIAGLILWIAAIAVWRKASLGLKITGSLTVLATLGFATMSYDYFFAHHPYSAMPTQTIKVGSLNKLVTNSRYQDLQSAIQNQDVVGMVEITNDDYKNLSKGWGYTFISDCQCDAALGSEIAIFSRYPIVRSEQLSFGINSGGMISVDIELEPDKAVSFLVVHPKAPITLADLRARDEQLKTISQVARKQSQPSLIMGDFNVAPWSQSFKEMHSDIGSEYQNLKPRTVYKTWCLGEMPVLCAPIDYIFVSNSIAVHDYTIEPVLGTDHDLLQATLSL